MKVTVARIGRAHGLKGEVSVELRTDIPEERLSAGAVLETEPPDAGPLTVVSTRTQAGRWYVKFAQLTTREDADAVRGVEVLADADDADEDDAWYIHELVGLAAVRPDGSEIGIVVDLLDMPAQDLLVVKEPNGHRAMIPFVDEFVGDVDIDGGRITLTPPHGLLAGEEPEVTGETG
jgi:16S rRNA processing protein RimM